MSKRGWLFAIAVTAFTLFLFWDKLWPVDPNAVVKVSLYAPPYKPSKDLPFSEVGEIKEARTITFALPRRYIVLGFGNRYSVRGEGSIQFGYWDKSFDPWWPERDAHRTPCIPSPNNPQPAIEPCPNKPIWARYPTAESFHTVELFNAVKSPAEHEYRTLQRLNEAKLSTIHCAVRYDPELRMITISLPPGDIPADLQSPTYKPIPNLCPTSDRPYGLGPSGEIARVRQPDGTYRAEFTPQIYYVHLDTDGRPIFSASSPGWISIYFEGWAGRLHALNINPRDWVAAHANALKFLARFKHKSTPN